MNRDPGWRVAGISAFEQNPHTSKTVMKAALRPPDSVERVAAPSFTSYLEHLIMKTFGRVPVVVLAGVLTLLTGCASTSQHESTGEYVDDTVLTTKVKTEVFKEPSLKSSEINVETFKGVVQLSGFVSTQSDIDKAVQVARGVEGVKSVKNDMRVK